MKNNLKKCIHFNIAPGVLSLSILLFAACEKEKPLPAPTDKPGIVYVLGTGFTNQPGGFLGVYTSLNKASIDNSNSESALQLSNFAAVAYKNHLYAALQTGTGMVKYAYNANGRLEQARQMALINGHNRIAFVSDSEAWFTSSGNLQIRRFNPAIMTLGGSIDFTALVAERLPDALSKNFRSCRDIIHRNNKLYVTLDFGFNDFTPAYDSAFVAVVNLSTNAVENLLIKPGCRMAGDWYPYTTSMFTDEQNDIYILCVGTYGNISNHPSKVIRIPAGQDTFDGYEMNLSVASGLSGGTARGLYYASNGKAYTALLDATLIVNSFFTAPCYRWVEVNLQQQTVVELNLPATAGFKGHGCTKDDADMIFPIFNNTELALFKLNFNTGVTEKITDISGGGYVQFITTFKP